jgi:UDP-N-acetyl-2-amino-2-deoxyglucuronate dehydrogenase
MSKNFAVAGVAGFVAPRHLKAIRDSGHRLIAAVDPCDTVGLLDGFAYDVRFFTEIERFDRHLEKLRRGPSADCVHYLSICSPNYLHDAHIRMALRTGADAICEKPLVLNPWNLDALQQLEIETGRRVYTVLQLRLHPAALALKARLARESSTTPHDVRLTYVTPRGRWYDVSWKGSTERSGGVSTNIGIHFFDLLLWLFGDVSDSQMQINEPRRASGVLELQRARVEWFLSVEADDLPPSSTPGASRSYRCLTIDGESIDLSEGFTDLHTRVYEEVLAGRGLGIDAARPSIELVAKLRRAPVETRLAAPRPMLQLS